MQIATKLRYDNFVNCFAALGWQNQAEAARQAKFAVSSARQTAARLMTCDYIKQAIAVKQAEMKAKAVATRQQRQEFWTNVYDSSANVMADRLRASELLGKSEADFVEKTVNLHADIPTDPEAYKSWLEGELSRLKGSDEVVESYENSKAAIAKRY